MRSPRQTSAQAGYTGTWAQRWRLPYLRDHPRCVLCQRAATVPDHYPRTRKQLVAASVHNPDAAQYLRALCAACHNRETARLQPGGWARERQI